MAVLKTTALNQAHRELGAKMVDFGGWDMPVQYTGILKEHQAVRTAAGLFDVSHMGTLEVVGPESMDFLQTMVPNNVAKLIDGKGLYTQLCHANGGTIDSTLMPALCSQQGQGVAGDHLAAADENRASAAITSSVERRNSQQAVSNSEGETGLEAIHTVANL